jgi:hypothetical protein
VQIDLVARAGVIEWTGQVGRSDVGIFDQEMALRDQESNFDIRIQMATQGIRCSSCSTVDGPVQLNDE